MNSESPAAVPYLQSTELSAVNHKYLQQCKDACYVVAHPSGTVLNTHTKRMQSMCILHAQLIKADMNHLQMQNHLFVQTA